MERAKAFHVGAGPLKRNTFPYNINYLGGILYTLDSILLLK